jgi:hypothetical protein
VLLSLLQKGRVTAEAQRTQSTTAEKLRALGVSAVRFCTGVKIENINRYLPLAVGLMEIENLVRYSERAVGLMEIEN